MNILITGSEGFIGRNLKNFLSQAGYSLLNPKYSELDLRKTEDVKNFFEKKKIDCIINCATSEVIHKTYKPTTCEDNLRMFFNLLKFKKKNTKFINLGSGSEYSREFWSHKMKEDFFGQYIPNDAHSFSKYIQSKYILESNNSNLYHLRLFGIFGKHEDYKFKFISNTIVKVLNSFPIIINKNCIYDYIFIDDFCKIVELFIKNNVKKKIFNITPTISIDLISIAKIILQELNISQNIKVIKEGFGREYTGDNSILLSTFPKIKFSDYKDSISSLIKFYQNNKNLIDLKSLEEDKFLDYADKINK